MKHSLYVVSLILCAVLLGVFDHELRRGDIGSAQLYQAVDVHATPPSSATTFEHPVPIIWTGMITRIFVSGQGLEITSADAPGGTFHAYTDDDDISPITSGSVTVRGLWRGWTCDYGARCVPGVDITAISRVQ